LKIKQKGADWFYLSSGNIEYIDTGIVKLFSGVCMLLCPICCVGHAIFDKNKPTDVICIIMISLLAIISFIWYTIDWMRILADVFHDGNGISLKNW
jgi:hypothetical protein